MSIHFDFSLIWDHNHFIEGLETFVNNPEDSLRKLIFSAYDFNNDHYISEIDLFLLMKSLSSGKTNIKLSNLDVFVTVVGKDVMKLVNFMNTKKLKKRNFLKKHSNL